MIGEDTLLSQLYRYEVDMAILSVGMEPRKDSPAIQRLLNLSCAADGFFLEAHPKLRPVDTPTSGIFLAGCAEGPKDIKDSVTQASAAASRANILMAQGKVNVEAITAVVDETLCQGCGLCLKVCPYSSIRQDPETQIAQVTQASCAGCGTCVAECPFSAITQRHFTDQQIYAQIDAITEEAPENKAVAFCCNWCSYAGADFAGVSRMQYPAPIRIIRTMCSGRISTEFIEYAFRRGRRQSWSPVATLETAIISMPITRPKKELRKSGKKWNASGWIKTVSSWPGSVRLKATSSPEK